MRRLRGRIPAALLAILGLAVVQGLLWIVLMPPLQGPDEVGHYTYTQYAVERQEIPWVPGGPDIPGDVRPYSNESFVVLSQAGFGPLAGNRAARPLWTEADERVWSRADAALTADDRSEGGPTTAMANPPLYYLYEAIPYTVARGGSFFDRAMTMRLANLPLLLIGVVFTWLLAGELLGRRWAQVTAAGSVTLLPQLTNITATINPDVMLVALWSAALYLMTVILRRGATRSRLGWLALVSAGALLTHGRSLPLLLPLAILVVLLVARARRWEWPAPVRVGLVAGGAYVAVVLAASEIGARHQVREFVSYVWQFYLPKLGFMTETIGPPDYRFREAFSDRMYGTLAQLEVTLDSGVSSILLWATLAGLVALVVALIVRRRAVARESATAVVLGAAVVGLVLGLHLASYRALVNSPGDPVLTARYLLPLLPLLGTAIAIVAGCLPGRIRAGFVGLVFAVGAGLQLLSIGLLVERFYA